MAEFMRYEDVGNLPVSSLIIQHIKDKNANKFEAFDDVDLICFDFLDISDTGKEYVIVMSVVVVAAMIIYFKKKKWF